MRTTEIRLHASEDDLLDAADDIRLLLDDDEISPPLRDLLLVLDDAITEAFAEAVTA